MGTLFADFQQAHLEGDGRLLADTISPFYNLEQSPILRSFSQMSNYQTVSADMRFHLLQNRNTKVQLSKNEASAWVEIFVALWNTVKAIASDTNGPGSPGKWSSAFDEYQKLATLLIRGYTHNGFQAWTVPCLNAVGKYLRVFAVRADEEPKSQETMTFGDGFQDDIMGNSGEHEKLEKAAWVINRMFTICLSDRSPIQESRKWGIYSTTNMLFKCYFQLNSISLTRNVLRALGASSSDLPPLSNEAYTEAIFRPLSECIKQGDLAGFDAALAAGEAEFVKRRIYLTLERGRDIALRNLFRKVFMAGGFEESKDGADPVRRTRVPVAEFAAALRLGNHMNAHQVVDTDEVECFLANLIYKGLMKGYIARERGIVVLSKGGTAFPGTGV
ncbi:MAG: hypothetical protein Q9227_000472 [Pyrenula ochraceoflavens]